MKLRWLFAILFAYTTYVVATTTDPSPEEFYDPNEDKDRLILWNGLFIKLNALLLETEKISQNLLDLNKRQEEQGNQLVTLAESVNSNKKYLDDSRLQISKLMDSVNLNSKHLNESLVESKERFDGINKRLEAQENLISKAVNRSQDWTTILRRKDGSVDFNRNWMEYQKGFGNPPNGEFFIGLDKLHQITTQGPPQELRVVLTDWNNETRYALYDHFKIGGADEKYILKVLGKYSGTAGDSMNYHINATFSTVDNDNDVGDGNCAITWSAGWWYKNCFHSQLTGLYRKEQESNEAGVSWKHWKGTYKYSLKFAEMKIRPKAL